ncbi:hypothetical protein TGME49_258870 [Toxoplasma gondii ME49]|uniref:Transmembrane protein n=3 Tax=Toxoplasma gondii TaxID=5811 RepID=A0A125YFF8_TOXGV|nr:hypothetical protein TGME49_258870 [Toxoplasma gondii ME49]EPT29388.1 hypothetical protein TGME49_258870 [Toxoplasma gondii ME49]ESS32242.1 putative transmembrane protein [Toxoplasma gondii VEG]|eukprot:XP_018637031.1 hypothetical protein TGME49_258870 [Toxoplasma gondii ME49]
MRRYTAFNTRLIELSASRRATSYSVLFPSADRFTMSFTPFFVTLGCDADEYLIIEQLVCCDHSDLTDAPSCCIVACVPCPPRCTWTIPSDESVLRCCFLATPICIVMRFVLSLFMMECAVGRSGIPTKCRCFLGCPFPATSRSSTASRHYLLLFFLDVLVISVTVDIYVRAYPIERVRAHTGDERPFNVTTGSSERRGNTPHDGITWIAEHLADTDSGKDSHDYRFLNDDQHNHVEEGDGEVGGRTAAADEEEESSRILPTFTVQDIPSGDADVHKAAGDVDTSTTTTAVDEDAVGMPTEGDIPKGDKQVYEAFGRQGSRTVVAEVVEDDSKDSRASQETMDNINHTTQRLLRGMDDGAFVRGGGVQEFVKAMTVPRIEEKTKGQLAGVLRLIEALEAMKGSNSKSDQSPRRFGCSVLQRPFRTVVDYDVVITTAAALANAGVNVAAGGGGPVFPVFPDVAKVRSLAEEPLDGQQAAARESQLRSRGFVVPVADMVAAVKREWSEEPIDCGRCTVGGGYLPVRLLKKEVDEGEELLHFADVEYPTSISRGTVVSVPASWLIVKGLSLRELTPGVTGFILCVENGEKPVFVPRGQGLFSQYAEYRAGAFRERVAVDQFVIVRGSRRNESVLEAKLILDPRAYSVYQSVNRYDPSFLFFGTIEGPPITQSLFVTSALKTSNECIIERTVDDGPVSLDCKGWRKFERRMREYEETKAAITKRSRWRLIKYLVLALGVASAGLLYAGHRKERPHGILRVRPSQIMKHKYYDKIMVALRGRRHAARGYWKAFLDRGIQELLVPQPALHLLSYFDAMHPENLRDALRTVRGDTDTVSRWMDWASGRREAAKGVLYKGAGGYGMAATGVIATLYGLLRSGTYAYRRSKLYLRGRKVKQYAANVLSQKNGRRKARRMIVFLVVQ